MGKPHRLSSTVWRWLASILFSSPLELAHAPVVATSLWLTRASIENAAGADGLDETWM